MTTTEASSLSNIFTAVLLVTMCLWLHALVATLRFSWSKALQAGLSDASHEQAVRHRREFVTWTINALILLLLGTPALHLMASRLGTIIGFAISSFCFFIASRCGSELRAVLTSDAQASSGR
jgi:heme/copper-type cytochrome/quinol oxidase subunit 2